jgi:hypothetical protein
VRRRRGRDPFCTAIHEEQAQQWRQTLLPVFQGESRVGDDWDSRFLIGLRKRRSARLVGRHAPPSRSLARERRSAD